MFKQIDCSNLRETSQKLVAEAFAPHTMFSHERSLDSRKRRENGQSTEKARKKAQRRRIRHEKNKNKHKLRHRPEEEVASQN
jgi:hypothetical protein